MADYFATGIIAYTSGDRTEALRYFRLAIRENPRNADAWYWLSLVVEDEERKRDCLLRCLALEPTHSSALESLQQLETSAPGAVEEIPVHENTPEQVLPFTAFASLEADEASIENRDTRTDDLSPVLPTLMDFDSDLKSLSAPIPEERRTVSRSTILFMTLIFILIVALGTVAVWFLIPGSGSPFGLDPGSPTPTGLAPAALPVGDSPEAAAANWLNAVLTRKSLDIARNTCLEEQPGMQSSGLKNDLLTAITGVENKPGQWTAIPAPIFELSGLQFTPFEPMEFQARVLVYGTLRMIQGDTISDYPIDDRFTIKHENGSWKWCGSDALNADRIAATQQAGAPPPTPQIPPPEYLPGDWRMESIAYQEIPAGEGWKQIQVDLVVENTSSYLGLVGMNSGSRIAAQGKDYPLELNFNARVLPGLRTHTDLSGIPLTLTAQVPAETDDLELHIPYRVELIELTNGQTAVGEGEFMLYPQQILPEAASIFIHGEWADYKADPPSGVYAAEIGEPIDFKIGLWRFVSFEYESVSADSVENSHLMLRGVLENPSQPANGEAGTDLTLTPADVDAIQFLPLNQWGRALLSDQNMGAIRVAPDQQEEVEVWSLARDQVPAMEAETWCLIGLFKAQLDDHIQDVILFSCMPLPPP